MDRLTYSLAGALMAASISGSARAEQAMPEYSLVVGTPGAIEGIGDDPRCTGAADEICLSALVKAKFTAVRTLAGPNPGETAEILFTLSAQRIRPPDMAMIVRRQSDGSLFAVEWKYVQGSVACFASEWFAPPRLDPGDLPVSASNDVQTCVVVR